MKNYEVMYIVNASVEEEKRVALIENLHNIITTAGGSIVKVDEWGLRDFAYEIKDYTKGYYVVVDTTTTPANIAEFERLSRINANVLRHLTIRR